MGQYKALIFFIFSSSLTRALFFFATTTSFGQIFVAACRGTSQHAAAPHGMRQVWKCFVNDVVKLATCRGASWYAL